MKEKDLTGNKFGKLLPLYPERKNGRIFGFVNVTAEKKYLLEKIV